MKFQLSHDAKMRHSRFHTGDAYHECFTALTLTQGSSRTIFPCQRQKGEGRAHKAALN